MVNGYLSGKASGLQDKSRIYYEIMSFRNCRYCHKEYPMEVYCYCKAWVPTMSRMHTRGKNCKNKAKG